MKTSDELIRKVESKVKWSAWFWVLSGMGMVAGKELGIVAVKSLSEGLILLSLWAGFGGITMLTARILDCTKAVLALIQEHKTV